MFRVRALVNSFAILGLVGFLLTGCAVYVPGPGYAYAPYYGPPAYGVYMGDGWGHRRGWR